MMDYKSLVESAVKNGGNEKAMWASVDVTNEIMGYLQEKDPAMYNCFMRKSYEAMHGKHYNQYFAEQDVAKIHYTDIEGKEHHRAYWTVEQIKEATVAAGYKFPAGTTDWDKFVAFNAAYADFSKKFDEKQILCIGYLFFFADEDWKSDGKIWDYMGMNK